MTSFNSPATACSVLALCVAAQAPAALAQEDFSVGVDTITVTATKREQTLQEIPVSVSVVDNQVIQDAQIYDLQDLQSVVPSLRVTVGQTAGTANFIIRGFGNGSQGVGIEPSVGVFVDGVYRSRAAASITDLPSVDRIEVLRGPQSTLFGKNASAGVISFVTAKPEFEFGGSLEATAGNNALFGIRGDVTGPINDQLAFSVGGSYRQSNGYATNLETGNDINDIDRWLVRGQLLWEPTNTLSVRTIFDADRLEETCCLINNVIGGENAAQIVASVGGNVVIDDPEANLAFYNVDPTSEIENQGVSAEIKKEFTGMDLTSITAYRTQDRRDVADFDFSTANILAPGTTDVEIDTFTHEFRLASTGRGRFQWLFGTFYFNETLETDTGLTYGDDAFGFYNGLSGLSTAVAQLDPSIQLFAPGTGRPSDRFDQDNEAFSVFADFDFELTDRLTLSAGVNYTTDKKEVTGTQVSTDPLQDLNMIDVTTAVVTNQIFAQSLAANGVDATDPVAVGMFAAANPTAFNTIQATAAAQGSAAVAADAAILQGQAVGTPVTPLPALVGFQGFLAPSTVDFPNVVEDGETDDNDTTWSVRLSYDLTDIINLFASTSTGFKASSWDLGRQSRPVAGDIPALVQAGAITDPFPDAGTRFAGPEETFLYEFGLKAQREFSYLYLTFFDQSIENFQTSVIAGGVTGIILANAEELSVRGIEVEAGVSALPGLDLTFAGTFLDPEYDEFTNSPFGDLSGTEPPNIHETNIIVTGRYAFPIRDSLSGFVRFDYEYASPVDVVPDPEIEFEREVNRVNASIGVTTDNGWTARLWGRNITDNETLKATGTSILDPDLIAGTPEAEPTWGFSLGKTF
ncbi:MAG: TonB-dependent receptor [Pseudomonadota bacterium]